MSAGELLEARAKFVMFCGKMKRAYERSPSVYDRFNDDEDDSERLKREIRDCREELTDLWARFYKVSGMNRADTGNDFDRLLKIPLMDFVEFAAHDLLIVHTKEIICTEPESGTQYLLGEFRIEINGDSGNDDDGAYSVRVFNKTRQVDGIDYEMNAPHVWADGEVCWGNLEESICKLYAKNDVATLVQLVISFLQTVNVHDDAGQFVHRWPVFKKKRRRANV